MQQSDQLAIFCYTLKNISTFKTEHYIEKSKKKSKKVAQ